MAVDFAVATSRWVNLTTAASGTLMSVTVIIETTLLQGAWDSVANYIYPPTPILDPGSIPITPYTLCRFQRVLVSTKRIH